MTLAAYLRAPIAEIPGCFAFRAWLRLGKWAVEGARPDRWDVIGGAVALTVTAIILLGPRKT